MKSAPEPTDPKETSAASTGTNVATAIANAYLGNITEFGPDGSTRVERTGMEQIYDPYTKKTYDVPTFTRSTTLSPEQQAIKDQQDQAKLNLSSLANDQSSFLQDYMSKPFSYDTGEHEKWAMGLFDSLNDDKEARRMAGLQTQLANSGVKLGSDAYGRAIESQEKASQDARNQFLLDSYRTGFSTAQASRNQPINEITALMSGGQVSQPSFMGANMPTIPTTDNAGIIANYDQQQLAAWQAKQAAMSNLLGGLFSFGSGIISDKRQKKNIKKIGSVSVAGKNGKQTKAGLFSYNYKWEKAGETPRHVGVMAQEVEKIKPEAVMTIGNGVKAVDYGGLFA